MSLDPSDTIGGNLTFIPQLYDRWERHLIADVLPEDGVFVDVGANLGAYSLWAAKVAPRGKVLAIEADPGNYNYLRLNFDLNKLLHATALNVGVSDEDSVLRLYLNTNGNRGGHTFLPGIHRDSRETVDVQCRTLAEILSESKLARVDFMKMDIEGFEPRVLRRFLDDIPLDSLLWPRHLLTEFFSDAAARDVRDLLAQAGYAEVRTVGSNAYFRRL
jgi:FkbM family methyltransferase